MTAARIIISAYVQKKYMGSAWWHSSFLNTYKARSISSKTVYSKEFTDMGFFSQKVN